ADVTNRASPDTHATALPPPAGTPESPELQCVFPAPGADVERASAWSREPGVMQPRITCRCVVPATTQTRRWRRVEAIRAGTSVDDAGAVIRPSPAPSSGH